MHNPIPLTLFLALLSTLSTTTALVRVSATAIPGILSQQGWYYDNPPLPIPGEELVAVREFIKEAEHQKKYRPEDLDWVKLKSVLMKYGWHPPTSPAQLLRPRQTAPPEAPVSTLSAGPCMLSAADNDAAADAPASACPEEYLRKMSLGLSKHGWHFEPTATPAIPSSPGPLPELGEEFQEMKSILSKWGWVHHEEPSTSVSPFFILFFMWTGMGYAFLWQSWTIDNLSLSSRGDVLAMQWLYMLGRRILADGPFS
ncbi:MAG: hypothetical protein Q9186_004270 [Xanthomendoza sp. 1 TL-2023]